MTAPTHTPPADSGLVDLRELIPEVWGPRGAHPGEATRIVPMRRGDAAIVLSGMAEMWLAFARHRSAWALTPGLPVAECKRACAVAAEYRRYADKAQTLVRQWIDAGPADLPPRPGTRP